MNIKDIVKSPNMARFAHYIHGNLYYNIETPDGTFQFPIPTVETTTEYMLPHAPGEDEIPYEVMKLSADLGTTTFESEYKAITLMRYIRKAITSGDFIKIQ